MLDLKVYKTYFDTLPLESINDLIGFNIKPFIKPYYNSISQKHDPKAGGAGITFTLKQNFKSAEKKYGLYFLAKENALKPESHFPLFEDFQQSFGSLPRYRKEFLNYFEFSLSGELLNKRVHYYSQDKNLMKFIGRVHDVDFSLFTHELEIYQDHLQKEKTKVNLLMDINNFEQYYLKTKRGNRIKNFIAKHECLNQFQAVAPGFYLHQEIDSIYFLDMENGLNSHIKTFDKLISIA